MDRIVVGIDGSPGADRALEWAIAEARTWGAHLEVVLAWSFLDQPTEQFKPDYGADDATATLAAAIERVGGTEGLDVTLTCVNDLPARALIEAADRADLIVVGSRGIGGFKGLLLGSVSQQLATYAPVPVVVIHPEKSST
ncbi:MAG: universal stress protein [Acidimicrobiia bacterium]|nr:universal stress protein [Acidimicrobiia bacterium]